MFKYLTTLPSVLLILLFAWLTIWHTKPDNNVSAERWIPLDSIEVRTYHNPVTKQDYVWDGEKWVRVCVEDSIKQERLIEY